MGKLGRIGLEPAQRYERARPGELIHIDVKKLGRIARPGMHDARWPRSARVDRVWLSTGKQPSWAGSSCMSAIDDATRLAYVEVLADEKAITAVGFLRRAVTHFASYGITVQAR